MVPVRLHLTGTGNFNAPLEIFFPSETQRFIPSASLTQLKLRIKRFIQLQAIFPYLPEIPTHVEVLRVEISFS